MARYACRSRKTVKALPNQLGMIRGAKVSTNFQLGKDKKSWDHRNRVGDHQRSQQNAKQEIPPAKTQPREGVRGHGGGNAHSTIEVKEMKRSSPNSDPFLLLQTTWEDLKNQREFGISWGGH